MPWHEDIIARLPNPHGGDERTLREDIADELSDHLECAYQRELRATNDDSEARRSALSRFGNPARIAYRLWFDALKERIMTQRIMFITNILLLIVVIGLSLALVSMMRKNESIMATMLARMEEMQGSAAPSPNPDWTTLEIEVHEQGTNRPIEGLRVQLSGPAFGAAVEDDHLHATTNDAGNCAFGPIRPGQFKLLIRGDGFSVEKFVTLYPGENEPIQLKCPQLTGQTAEVSLLAAAEDPRLEHVQYLKVELEPIVPKWERSFGRLSISGTEVLIDLNSGLMTKDRLSDLSHVAANGAEAISLSVDFEYRVEQIRLYLPPEMTRHSMVIGDAYVWSNPSLGDHPIYTVKPGQRSEWAIALPEEFEFELKDGRPIVRHVDP